MSHSVCVSQSRSPSCCFQAVRFLQGMYGFVVVDYNYESMLAYRGVAQSAMVVASALARSVWPVVHAGGQGSVVCINMKPIHLSVLRQGRKVFVEDSFVNMRAACMIYSHTCSAAL